VGSAIDVACHEGYPGHHAQFLLQDQRAQPAGLPVEDRVVLLRSPASVLREGAANFGVELAFPFEERVAFDERVLFPLARLDPRQARRYETVHRLVDQLSAAAAPIIASYRDNRLSSDDAEQQLGIKHWLRARAHCWSSQTTTALTCWDIPQCVTRCGPM